MKKLTKNQWVAVVVALLVVALFLIVPSFAGIGGIKKVTDNGTNNEKKIDDGGINVDDINKVNKEVDVSNDISNINNINQMNPQVSIKDVVVGVGEEAIIGKEVSVHYAGSFLNGKLFDSSYGKEPLTFTIEDDARLIPGFIQGVIGMKVGGIRKVIIPPELAYGSRGQGSIPSNSTLVFELKLIKVVNK